MSKEEYQNCPTHKNIADHFQEQLVQLRLEPKAEDRRELMEILNKHLSYPDDELTNFHRLANKLGLLDLETEERSRITGESHNMKETRIFKMNNKACKCCGFFVQPDDLSVCQCSPEHIKNLGTANRIFFETFCYVSVLLVVMAVVYSGFALVTNVSVAQNTNYLNSTNLDYLSISLGAKSRHSVTINQDGQTLYYISAWLGVGMLVVWAIALGFIKKQIAMIEYTAKRKLGISDFSIVIENMPTDFSKQDIQKSLQDYLRQKKEEDFDNEITLKELEVVSYNEGTPFYLDEKEFTDQVLSEILSEYDQLKDTIASYVVEYKRNGKFMTDVSDRTYSYTKFQEVQRRKRDKYQEIVAQMRKKMEGKQQVNRTVVFVTFLTFEQRNFMISNNKNSLFYRIKRALQFWKDSQYFKVKKGEETFEDLMIELPPEPQDINWGNLGLSNCQKFMRLCLTILASLILVGISFVIVYSLSTVQKDNTNKRFISILISLAISGINLLIIKMIQFMTVLEKVYSMNNYQISIAFKSVFVQLVNSIAVPIIVCWYLKNGNIFDRSGLCEDIFLLGLASSFVPPIVKLVDPWNLFLILRFKYYGNEERRLYLNQFQLNEVSEKMEFEIGLEYIYLIHNFIFTCFFVSLQPIIALFAIVAYFCMYWIQKYSLFSRCQRPVPGPDVVTSKLYQLIFFGAVAFALGNLTWSWFLPDQGFRNALLPNLISLGLSLLILIFPYEKLVRSQVVREQKNYNQKRIYFPSEYDRLNPATAKKSIQEYRGFLESKKKELEGGNAQLQNQIIKGFDNLSHNNIYKPNYMNRLSNRSEDLVIQQLFYNESHNVLDPRLLYSAIMPHHNHNHNNQIRSTPQQPKGPSSSAREFVYQPQDSHEMMPDIYPDLNPPQHNMNHPQHNMNHNYNQNNGNQMSQSPNYLSPVPEPFISFQQDIGNVYHSNFRLDDDTSFKMTDSRMLPQNRGNNNNNNNNPGRK